MVGGVNDSKLNEGEADVVVTIVNKLLSANGTGLQPSDVGIISPYNAQVDTLRNRLRPTYPAIEINSVDSFQVRRFSFPGFFFLQRITCFRIEKSVWLEPY